MIAALQEHQVQVCDQLCIGRAVCIVHTLLFQLYILGGGEGHETADSSERLGRNEGAE